MAVEQFIVAVLPQHSRSMYDKYLEAEEKEFEKYTIVSSAQEMKIIKSAARAEAEAVFKHVDHIGVVSQH
jgi:DNA-directed RNA polymerase III subunit RPC3